MTISADRLSGVSTSVAQKAPVRAATTGNIILFGLQTIDGVALSAGDRVLVKNQGNSVQNGIYNVASSEWTRAVDFNGARDVVQGTLIFVIAGSTHAGDEFYVSSSEPTIGSSGIVFTLRDVGSGGGGGSQGANSQALDGLSGAVDQLPYFTGAGTMALTKITERARNFLNDASAASQRTTLDLTDVGTYEFATEAQAEGGTDTQSVMNPFNTKLAIDEFAASSPITQIGTYTLSNDSALDISFNPALYDTIVLRCSNIIPQNDASDLMLRLSTDGGTSFAGSLGNYDTETTIRGTPYSRTDAIELCSQVGGEANEPGWSGVVYIHNPNDAASRTMVSAQGAVVFEDGNVYTTGTAGYRTVAENTDALRILFATGNMVSGTVVAEGWG